MKRIFLLPLLIFTMCTAPAEQSNEINLIDAGELNQILTDTELQLVDIRTEDETSAGMLEHAINIDYYSPDFLERMNALEKNKPLAIYCASGMRSAQASKELITMGFVSLYDLQGGYSAWEQAGFKTVRPDEN